MKPSVVVATVAAVAVAASRRAHTGRAKVPGQEPLELRERGAGRAHGRRARRDGVHAVPGRRPRQLHGGGHVRAVP